MINNLRKWFYREQAVKNMNNGNTLHAEKWYKKLEAMDHENADILHNLALIYISLRQYSEAEKYLHREIELFGESERLCKTFGDLYFIMGEREKSGNAYNKALSLMQTDGCDQRIARFLRRRIKHCRDDKSFTQAMEGVKFYEEGAEYYKMGNFREALELYYKAVECDGSSVHALNAAGSIHLKYAKDYDMARKFFRKALELSDMPVIRNNLAIAERKIREERGEL